MPEAAVAASPGGSPTTLNPADAVEATPVFLPVEIHGADVPATRMASLGHGAHGRVEIVLATAHRLVVEGSFDADALARLLSVLARP